MTDDLRAALLRSFRWRSDPPRWPGQVRYADDSQWWRRADVLSSVGPALARLFADSSPTVVMGVASRGSLLGPLVATELGIGFAEVRKGAEPCSDDDVWLTRRTRPDYRDRQLELAIRRGLIGGGDRVLFVDDWIATGGQAAACKQLATDADATWVGAAVVVDGLESAADRWELQARGLVHLRELNRLKD